jgi:hypothetical protein
MIVMVQALCSPDIVQCDFIFPELNLSLKGRSFEEIRMIQAILAEFKTQDFLLQIFQHWTHCIEFLLYIFLKWFLPLTILSNLISRVCVTFRCGFFNIEASCLYNNLGNTVMLLKKHILII